MRNGRPPLKATLTNPGVPRELCREVRPASRAPSSVALEMALRAAPIAVAMLLASAAARADTGKQQCIDANLQAQELRRAGKLSSAREQLRACTNAACPALVRNDCAQRLDELERVQPGIVFDAKDGAGHDLSLVKVTVDGHPLADRLDGTRLPVDPGAHVFVFTVADQPPLTVSFVLKEGEPLRHERIILGKAAPEVSAAAGAQPSLPKPSPPPTPPASSRAAEGQSKQKVLALAAGAVGVAGVAVGAVFGVLTLSEVSKQQADCASVAHCLQPAQAATDHSSALTDRTVSTAAFIAGGALLAGGAALFLSAGPRSDPPPTARMLVVPSVTPGGAGISWSGKF